MDGGIRINRRDQVKAYEILDACQAYEGFMNKVKVKKGEEDQMWER